MKMILNVVSAIDTPLGKLIIEDDIETNNFLYMSFEKKSKGGIIVEEIGYIKKDELKRVGKTL